MSKVQRRILALAGLLRSSSEPLSWQEIQERFAAVGEYRGNHTAVRKKLMRDRELLRELGLAVSYDATVDGYGIDEQCRRSRGIELTAPEAGLLRQATALVHKDGSSPFGPDVLGALQSLEAMDFRVLERVLVHQPGRDGQAIVDVLRRLTLAAWKRHTVSFTYRSERGGVRLHREVQPWGLFSRRGRWYLVGHDCQREHKRCFRLRMMREVVVHTTGSVRYEIPEQFDIQREANLPRWDWEVHEPITAVLLADAELAPLVARQLGVRANGERIVRSVTNCDALVDLVTQWLPRVRVEAPESLVDEVREWMSNVTARHGEA